MRLPSLPSFAAGTQPVAIGAGALLLLLLVGFGFWRLSARSQELEARIAQEVTDSTRFATTIALISTLEARQDTIEQKIEVIRSVDQRRYVWPHLLDEISRAVPAYTWLTQITSAQATAGGAPPAGAPPPAEGAAAPAPAPVAVAGPSLTLQGNAGSTQALTRLMKNLEASSFIRDVTLVTSEQVPLEGRTIHRFSLEARYENPPESVIQTVPVVIVN